MLLMLACCEEYFSPITRFTVGQHSPYPGDIPACSWHSWQFLIFLIKTDIPGKDGYSRFHPWGGLYLVLPCFQFIPDQLLTVPVIHRYSQFIPTQGTGPPNLTVLVRNIQVSRVMKRTFLSRKCRLGGVCRRVLVYSRGVRKSSFLLRNRNNQECQECERMYITLGYSPMEGDLSDINNCYSPLFSLFWAVLPVPNLDTGPPALNIPDKKV